VEGEARAPGIHGGTVGGASITPKSASCVRRAQVPRDCRAAQHQHPQRLEHFEGAEVKEAEMIERLVELVGEKRIEEAAELCRKLMAPEERRKCLGPIGPIRALWVPTTTVSRY
jgi:hypothetical protein